jgi:hypothetical protein
MKMRIDKTFSVTERNQSQGTRKSPTAVKLDEKVEWWAHTITIGSYSPKGLFHASFRSWISARMISLPLSPITLNTSAEVTSPRRP